MPYPYLWRIKCLFVRPKISFYVPKMPLLFSINIALLRLSFDLFCFAWLLTVRSFVFFPQIGLLISHRFLLFYFLLSLSSFIPKIGPFLRRLGVILLLPVSLLLNLFFSFGNPAPIWSFGVDSPGRKIWSFWDWCFSSKNRR